MTEAQLHTAVIDYLSRALNASAVVHHSPNEGRRGWKAQRALKTHGTRKGWPDIEIVAGGHVYFLELKAPRKYPTPAQRACHMDLRAAGCEVAVCRSIEEIAVAVTGWGLTRGGTE